MRFLIINIDYPDFLHWLYANHPGLKDKPYQEQVKARRETLFGIADFYASNLCKLGYEALVIHSNNEFMQKAWARENGLLIERSKLLAKVTGALARARRIAERIPFNPFQRLIHTLLGSGSRDRGWFYRILAEQIKHYRPDVLLNLNMILISPQFLREMKPYVRLLVGQIAAPFNQKEDYGCYDLVISSLPNFVEFFRGVGIPSEFLGLAFEPEVLDAIGECSVRSIDVSFVGGLRPTEHDDRVKLLEYLCERVEIQLWGRGVEKLPESSPIWKCYRGHAWGREMFRILARSKITLNCHGKWAGRYANNMRLYEATGVGTLLITDWKENLHELFEPGKEVVTYHTPEECAELIVYYLEHEEEREAIARAGQKRTLREHTYYHRMQEFVDIVRKYI